MMRKEIWNFLRPLLFRVTYRSVSRSSGHIFLGEGSLPVLPCLDARAVEKIMERLPTVKDFIAVDNAVHGTIVSCNHQNKKSCPPTWTVSIGFHSPARRFICHKLWQRIQFLEKLLYITTEILNGFFNAFHFRFPSFEELHLEYKQGRWPKGQSLCHHCCLHRSHAKSSLTSSEPPVKHEYSGDSLILFSKVQLSVLSFRCLSYNKKPNSDAMNGTLNPKSHEEVSAGWKCWHSIKCGHPGGAKPIYE